MDRPFPVEVEEEPTNSTKTQPFNPWGTRDLLGGIVVDPPRNPYQEPLLEVYAYDKNFFYYFFIMLYLVILTVSLSLNAYLLRNLYKNWSKISVKPFYTLIFILCLVNLIAGVADAVCNVPVVTFLDSSSPNNITSEVTDYTFTVFYKIFYNLELVSEQMVQWLTLWIAALRFVIVIIPSLERILFNRIGLVLFVGFGLTISCVQIAYMAINSCYFRYEFAGFFTFGCYDFYSGDENLIYFGYYFTRIYLPIIVFILYLIIFIRIMCLKTYFNTHKLERTVLFQSFVIFITLELAGVLTIYLMTGPLIDKAFVFNTRRILDTADTLAAVVAPALLLVSGVDRDPKKKKKKTLFRLLVRKCFYALPKGAQNKVFPTYVVYNCCDCDLWGLI